MVPLRIKNKVPPPTTGLWSTMARFRNHLLRIGTSTKHKPLRAYEEVG